MDSIAQRIMNRLFRYRYFAFEDYIRRFEWSDAALGAKRSLVSSVYLAFRDGGPVARAVARYARGQLIRPLPPPQGTLDDRHHGYFVGFTKPSTCMSCSHRVEHAFGQLLGPTCDAFPYLIPQEIWRTPNGHTDWYPGDRGYRYTPMTPTDYARSTALNQEGYMAWRDRVIRQNDQTLAKWRRERVDWIAAGAPDSREIRNDWIWY